MSPALSAPSTQSGGRVLSAAQRDASLREIERIISQHYVFADLRAPLIARLEAARATRRYDVLDPTQFAELVTEDLKAVSRDGHLYLKSDPGEYAAAKAPPASGDGLASYRRALAVRDHYGLAELKVLSGNIRYIKITGFKWLAGGPAATAYDQAAAFLADGDAVIVDLRGNGGGESDAADYFLKTIVRLGDKPDTIGDPSTRRPLYILVDGLVGSAAEAVTYSAQIERRAAVVGATTFGAANNNKRYPVDPLFILSVSYNRPINPISHTNWEGVGVIPDIKVDPELATEAAQLDALDRLSVTPRLPADRLAEYRWLRAGLEARLRPPMISDDLLRSRAGTYGTITLRYAEGQLRLSRSDRPRWPLNMVLRPMSNDGVFALQGTDDIRVRITDTAVKILRPDGSAPQVFERTAVGR